jgi:hypothetical protein
MPNEQTSVPLFASGEVLTASNLNLSAGTGVPVFTNTTTRDAAFGGTGEKVLAEGQLCYLSSTNVVQYYDGAAWATVGPSSAGGLVFISATTIGTSVASVTVSSAFSATYDNYRIIVSGGSGSASPDNLFMTLGATATGYYWARTGRSFADSDNGGGAANQVSWRAGGASSTTLAMNADLFSPFLSDQTWFSSTNIYATTTGSIFNSSGYLDNTTSYTAFTLTAGSGTLTGGTIRVYGYANS